MRTHASNQPHDQTQTLAVSVCLELRRKERKYIMVSVVLWIASVIFIVVPPTPRIDDVNAAFLETLFRHEHLQWRIFRDLSEKYRSLFPELLYRHIQEEVDRVRKDIEERIRVTDFTSVNISDDLLVVDTDGDGITVQFNLNPTEEEKDRILHLNKIQHILDTQDFSDSGYDRLVIAFYKDHFPLFEQHNNTDIDQPRVKLFWKGKYKVL